MDKYYNKNKRELLFCGTKATPDFWDNHWNVDNFKNKIEGVNNNNYVIQITKKFLDSGKDKRILEGGCGKGQFVYALKRNGYDVYGIDYAKKTVRKTKSFFYPDLKISIGDVRKLNFENNSFDCYWSLGVIEHFYDGYRDIIDEMYRVLKKGGYLFLVFPNMSLLRIFKARLGFYKNFNANDFDQEKFYQFILNSKNVIRDLEDIGFQLEYKKILNGKKGLKDEVCPFKRVLSSKRVLSRIYKNDNIFLRFVSKIIDILFTPFCGHAILLVFKK